ncbi:MAG: hypothetical protein K2Q12_05395 [Rickettsiales bacterium]|nr:hypothetical protein [Rickettsiales bacterium]
MVNRQPDNDQYPRSRSDILKLPLTQLRQRTATLFNLGRFPREEFDKLFSELPTLAKQLGRNDEDELQDTITALKNAVDTGWPPERVNLRTEGLQLAWAITMFYLQANPEICSQWPQEELRKPAFKETKLWNRLRTDVAARYELANAGRTITRLPISKETTIAWDVPGSWYYYSPSQKHINIDLAFSCLAGVEHARDSIFHEIGHALLSLDYTPQMKEIQQRIHFIRNIPKKEKRKLTQIEYREIFHLSVEWKLRHMIWNCLEDTSMNRFVRNQSEKWDALQNYGVSLNHTETCYSSDAELIHRYKQFIPEQKATPAGGTTTSSLGEQPKGMSDEAYKKLRNVGSLGLYQFFIRNGLIADTMEGYQSVDLHPEWVGNEGMDTIRRLVSDEFEMLQPNDLIARYGAKARQEFTRRLAVRRGAVIDEFWNCLCAEHAKIVLNEFDKNFEPSKMVMQPGQSGGVEVEGMGTPMALPHLIPESPEAEHEEAKKPKNGSMTLQDALDSMEAASPSVFDPRNVIEHKSTTMRNAAQGNIAIHHERVARMQPVIQAGRPLLEELLKRRYETAPTLSPDHQLIGDLRNLDIRKAERLEELRATSAATAPDYDRFNREDGEIQTMARPRLVLMIDDSGSMDFPLGDGKKLATAVDGKKLATAADAATAFIEMTKGLPIDVYVYACGNANPIPIAKPGDTEEDIAANMASLMKAQGTEALRPPLRQFIQDVLDETSPYLFRGNTMVAIISDGHIHDMDHATGLLQSLRTHTGHVSVDCLIIENNTDTRMHKAAKKLTANHPSNPILIRNATTAQQVHDGIIALLTHRLEQTVGQPAFTADQERVWLENAIAMENQQVTQAAKATAKRA